MSGKNYVVIDGKTINLSDETVRNLKSELGIKTEFEFGDIVSCTYGKRLILKDSSGKLIPVNSRGREVGSIQSGFYKSTEKNIFKDNVLDLAC